MDFIAHALWSGAAAKGYNTRQIAKNRPLSVWVTAFFGVFPDIFAFSPAFIYMLASYLFPSLPKMYHPGPDNPPIADNGLFIDNITENLYNISHSLVIYLAVFMLIWMITKQFRWESLAWFLHILIDIPTHNLTFYPTPFLWPISNFKINGYHWANWDFMAINYFFLAIVYVTIFWSLRRNRPKIG